MGFFYEEGVKQFFYEEGVKQFFYKKENTEDEGVRAHNHLDQQRR
jgi:hypothetical protein